MSPRLSRLTGALLICLLILAGISTYQFLHDHQRTNLINDHRSNIPTIAEAAITQALKQRGFIRLQGIVHSASSRPAVRNSSGNCYSQHITASLEGEKASIVLLDLHNCSELHKGQDCRAGGQVCISFDSHQCNKILLTTFILTSIDSNDSHCSELTGWLKMQVCV